MNGSKAGHDAAVDAALLPADWRDFVALTKPRVMTLVVFTGLCGLLVAPGHLPLIIAFTAILCIALGAGAAGALNQWYESDRDAKMKRTANRPLPAGRMTRESALHFGVGLSFFSVLLLGIATNWFAAAILAVSILFYVFVYTIWLKPRTAQKHRHRRRGRRLPATDRLGGRDRRRRAAAHRSVRAHLLLDAAAFLVARPVRAHGLCQCRHSDAARRVRRSRRPGGRFCSTPRSWPWPRSRPCCSALTGLVYGVTALLATGVFAAMAMQVGLRREADPARMGPEKRLFKYSVLYLFLLFGAVVVDHWIPLGVTRA